MLFLGAPHSDAGFDALHKNYLRSFFISTDKVRFYRKKYPGVLHRLAQICKRFFDLKLSQERCTHVPHCPGAPNCIRHVAHLQKIS